MYGLRHFLFLILCITPVFSNLARCTRYNQHYGLHLQHSIDVFPNSPVSSNNKIDRRVITEFYLSHYLNHIFYVYARFFKQRSRLHERTTLIFPSKQFTSNDRQYHELSNTNNLSRESAGKSTSLCIR